MSIAEPRPILVVHGHLTDLQTLLIDVIKTLTGNIRLKIVHPHLSHELYLQLSDASYISEDDIANHRENIQDTDKLVKITQAYHFEYVTSKHIKKYNATETWTAIRFDDRIIG